MYAVSLFESRVLDVYNTDVYVDAGVQIFEISESDFHKIAESGVNGDWVYSSGSVEYDPIPVVASASQNKAEAERRLAATDWVNQPDVYDTSNTPHLTNRDVFITYRSQIRVIAVNPVSGNLDWPTEPQAAWSN